MVEFKRVNVCRDSFGVTHYFMAAVGLPEGVSCRMSPEEADRPRGEWMVNVKKGGRKRTIRCISKDDATEKATEWCLGLAAKRPRPAKREAKK